MTLAPRTDAAGVAVIVPCYNDGATVRDAVASALVDEPSEIVVVDDGSDDPETARVLALLAAEGVHVINKANGGVSTARMAGVHQTASPLIVCLDADDMLLPGSLIDLAAALDDNDDVAVAYGDYDLFGTVEGPRRARGWDPWTICHVNRLAGGATMVRRQALLDGGGWQLSSGYEDWDLWMAMLENGERAVHVDRAILRYRQADGRMLSESLRRHEQLFASLQARHPALFADRRRNWWASKESLYARIVLPLASSLPVFGATARHRLVVFLYDPVAGIVTKLSRLDRHLRHLRDRASLSGRQA